MKQITCVVDNTVRQGSSFWGEHGLAFRIEIDQVCALFDTGHSGTVLAHNLGLLGKCPRNAGALILSHAHLDHTGGLTTILSQKPGLPLYASPDIFRPRFSVRNGKYKDIGLPVTREKIAQLADMRLNSGPVEVLPGLWTTGEIEERPEPEGRSPRHVVPHGDSWQPDPYRDDMSLVLETPTGLVVICGCCHAGLLNTLAHVRRTFRGPIIAVMGGTHLIEADEAHLAHVVELLRYEYESPQLYLNHCTGERAYLYLAKAFGELVHYGSVGTTLMFD